MGLKELLFNDRASLGQQPSAAQTLADDDSLPCPDINVASLNGITPDVTSKQLASLRVKIIASESHCEQRFGDGMPQ